MLDDLLLKEDNLLREIYALEEQIREDDTTWDLELKVGYLYSELSEVQIELQFLK